MTTYTVQDIHAQINKFYRHLIKELVENCYDQNDKSWHFDSAWSITLVGVTANDAQSVDFFVTFVENFSCAIDISSASAIHNSVCAEFLDTLWTNERSIGTCFDPISGYGVNKARLTVVAWVTVQRRGNCNQSSKYENVEETLHHDRL